MPGQWHPFCSGGGGNDESTGENRKRKSMQDGDLEIFEEHPVSPKRHRFTRNVSSPAKFNFVNPIANNAFGFSQLPFAFQSQNDSTAFAISSPAFDGGNKKIGSPMAMEIDDHSPNSLNTEGIRAASYGMKTPERSAPPDWSMNSPEICRQFYWSSGYSPSLIDRKMEERTRTNSVGELTGQKRNESGAIGCCMIRYNSDIY